MAGTTKCLEKGRGVPLRGRKGVEKKAHPFFRCGTNVVSSNEKVSQRCFTQPLNFSGVGKNSVTKGLDFLHMPLQHLDWLKLGIMKHQPLTRPSRDHEG